MLSEPPYSPLFSTCGPLILASGSPRRQQYFDELGLRYEVKVADVDEQLQEGEEALPFVKRLSLLKADTVARVNSEAWVVGADTVVVLDGRIMGKPVDGHDALRTLQLLRGCWHEVWTGFSVCNVKQGVVLQNAVRTDVCFATPTDEVLQAYVATGEPLDKAGAYGIQGRGRLLVREIKGSYSNVVGLPVSQLVEQLLKLGVIRPYSSPSGAGP